jgi:hypothetical protein
MSTAEERRAAGDRGGSGMTAAERRRVYLILCAIMIVLFGGGVAYWVTVGQNSQLCSNGKPPVQEQDQLLEPTAYLCSNGQTVTSDGLP